MKNRKVEEQQKHKEQCEKQHEQYERQSRTTTTWKTTTIKIKNNNNRKDEIEEQRQEEHEWADLSYPWRPVLNMFLRSLYGTTWPNMSEVYFQTPAEFQTLCLCVLWHTRDVSSVKHQDNLKKEDRSHVCDNIPWTKRTLFRSWYWRSNTGFLVTSMFLKRHCTSSDTLTALSQAMRLITAE